MSLTGNPEFNIKIFYTYGNFHFHFLPHFFALHSGYTITFISSTEQKVSRNIGSANSTFLLLGRVFLAFLPNWHHIATL